MIVSDNFSQLLNQKIGSAMMHVRDKFFQLLRNPDQDSAKRVWEEFISQEKAKLQGTNKNITLEISDNGNPINCTGWNFGDVDVIILGEFRRMLTFDSSIFKSLTVKKDGVSPAHISSGLNIKNSTVLKSLNFNVQMVNSGLNFEEVKILGSECKIIIYSSSDLNFINTQLGDNKGSYEINFISGMGKVFFKNTKICTSKFLIKTDGTELNFEGASFSDGTELSLMGRDNQRTSLNFSNTTLSHFEKTTFKFFGKIFGDDLVFKNSKLLEFEHVAEIAVSKISDCQISNLDQSKHLQIITNDISNSVFNSYVTINRFTQHEKLLIQKTVFNKSLTTNGNGSIVKLVDCDISSYNTQDRAEIIKCRIDHFTASGWFLLVKDKSKIGHLSTTGDTKHLEVENSIVGKSDFRNSTFSSCAIFSNVTFKEAPHISDIEFSSCNVEFRDIEFFDKKSGVAAGAFRALMKACSDAGYEHGVIFFHALELETRYNWHLKKVKFLSSEWPEKLFSLMHKHFTCYGTNLIRPLIILGFIWSIGYCWNVLFFFANSGIFDFNSTALVSLRNSLGPLMFALPDSVRKIDKLQDNLLINIFSFFQIVVSSGIWFVLFFMIRRRFKI